MGSSKGKTIQLPGNAAKVITGGVTGKLRTSGGRVSSSGTVQKPGGGGKPGGSKIPAPPPAGTFDRRIFIDPKKYPQTSAHIRDAQNNGHPSVLTKDSADKKTVRARRRAATNPLPARPRKTQDRDEYPWASTAEGGKGASVRYVDWDDNQGEGREHRNQWAGLPQGSKVWVDTYDRKWP